MLPFLRRKDSAATGIIMKTRTPDSHNEPNEDNSHSEAKLACARDLISAVKAGDEQGVCDALESYHEVSEPDGDEPSPHSYDAQNALAASNKGQE